MMESTLQWTSRDLEALPEDGSRYEIIDGELFVSKQPHYYHQRACAKLVFSLEAWSRETGLGEVTGAPGLIFAEDNDVAPDIAWTSFERLRTALGSDGKLHAAPDLVVEVLSPGASNERRDREAKLRLYSRRGVHEYWIVDWIARQIEVYRREDAQLSLVSTLYESDTLASPLLPEFSLPVAELFKGFPPRAE
ncbi:MAG TPA: Uma2 family endonuclease [Blastocatellia bacterium]|nr:Uma2 family endonuclease [Blastocatellia bacterium]